MMADKIKAFEPHIIVNTKDVEPYYSIMYYDTSDKHWHIGFGSYNLSFVRKWLQEEFEVVDVDFVEVVRCAKCKYGDVSTISKAKDGEEEIACYCTLKKVVTNTDSYCPSGRRRDAE